MNLYIRTHHHPADDFEPDDLDEVAEEEKLEEIRSRFVDWDPLRDVSEGIESWPARARRQRRRAQWLRATRRRAGRR